MKENIVRLDEQSFYKKINEKVHSILKEYYGDKYDDYDYPNMPESAYEDFHNSDFEQVLNNRYPDKDFDFEVDSDGTVTVTDLETEKYYTGQGEVEYEVTGLGYPSKNDYDTEEEGEVPYYDFTNCLRTVMEKIDNDKPDGVCNGTVIETNNEEISEAIKEVFKSVLSKD